MYILHKRGSKFVQMSFMDSPLMGHSMSNIYKVLTLSSQILMIFSIPVSFVKKIRTIKF